MMVPCCSRLIALPPSLWLCLCTVHMHVEHSCGCHCACALPAFLTHPCGIFGYLFQFHVLPILLLVFRLALVIVGLTFVKLLTAVFRAEAIVTMRRHPP